MKINKENSLLLIIDMQEKILPAMDKKEELLDNSLALLKGFQTLKIPIFSTVQYKKGLGDITPLLLSSLNDAEYAFIEKFEFSCMQNSSFVEELQKFERRKIFVIGIESHVCVEQTVIDLIEEDYHPIVVADCVSSRKPYDKKISLERMRDYGADITTYEAALFELLVTSKAAEFKAISNLIK